MDCLVGLSLNQNMDTWKWALGCSDDYQVAATRQYIDEVRLGEGCSVFEWNNLIPIKVNIFSWKLSLKRLPTKDNLLVRGIASQDPNCVNCCNGLETINHVFFTCNMAMDLWSLCGRWCGLNIPILLSWDDWRIWMESLRLVNHKKKILEAISFVLLWSIWGFRNSTCFAQSKPRKGDLFHKIVVYSFLWITNRDRKRGYDWGRWRCNPLM